MAAFHGSSSSSCSSSSSSFSSFASSISRCTYDVFLSFRGKDTRKTFTAHLYAALRRNDVNTFMDNKLRSGEEISPALLEAIKESTISIIVLSKNYASSQWCLDELMKILECKKTRGQQILPLFYHVHPSEVRNQTNSVGKAFAKLQERFKHDQMKLRRWKTALSQIGNLSGKLLGNRNEPEFIHEIIQLVNSMLVKNTYFQVAEYPESHVQYVKPLLDLEKNDSTCMVGIFETGGIDKTTIAKAIYNSIASLTEENRRSDRRNQALHALDSEKKAKDLIDSESKKSDETNLVLHKLDNERHLKDLMNMSKFREEDEKFIDILDFHLERIVVATDGFSYANMIGNGGFGYVYKGTFLGGQEIAVKRLSSASSQGFQEFKNEVALIKNLQHRNIVRLRGYCMEGDEKILLYEYMRKGCLDSFIFDRNPSKYLDWEMRINIIWGIARGLLYLHHDSRLRIIHRDLKPSNILLDEEMNPKIADFGCATIVEGKNTEARTMRIVGTYGYVAPEYMQSGIFSVKSDVYSFGVILLEVVCGKRNTKLSMSLIDYAWILWIENKVLDLVDQTLREVCNADQFVKYINIGLLCVQDDPHDRPTMSNVVTMLGSEAAVPTPKQPTLFRRTGLSNTTNFSTRPQKHTKSTISEIYDEVHNESQKRVREKKTDEALEQHLVLKYDKLYYNGIYLEECKTP